MEMREKEKSPGWVGVPALLDLIRNQITSNPRYVNATSLPHFFTVTHIANKLNNRPVHRCLVLCKYRAFSWLIYWL